MRNKLYLVSNVNMKMLGNVKGFLGADVVDVEGYDVSSLEKALAMAVSGDIIFVHMDMMMGYVPTSMSADAVTENGLMVLKYVESHLEGNKDVLFVVSNVCLPPFRVITHCLDSDLNYGISENTINRKIAMMTVMYDNFLMLDFNSLVMMYGYCGLYSADYFYLSRSPYKQKGYELLKSRLESVLDAYYGRIKKVLVLDLDNTLWGGVVGEDGVDGIKLSNEGIGKAFLDFQMCIRSLRSIGVLLAINSKNNPIDVNKVFDEHKQMALKRDDFTVCKINWRDKVTNMKEIAAELGLGLDSFVFIDDSEFERNYVGGLLPEVAVPTLPKDVAELPFWFINEVVYKYFPKLKILDEDRNKAQQYSAYLERKKLSVAVGLSEYIQSLNIAIDVYSKNLLISRLAQLTQKTNQFNLTTKRYTETDMVKMLDDGVAVYAMDYADKFGKEGTVGLAIVSIQKTWAYLDTFLMSCRIIGRRVEYAFLLAVVRDIIHRFGNMTIVGLYNPTEKNVLVKDFYSSCGMHLMNDSATDYELQADKLMENLVGMLPTGMVVREK